MNLNVINLINSYHVTRVPIINDINNENYINNYVNHIYVINLEEDVIRRRYITVLMKKYNINFEFIVVPRLREDEHLQIGNPYIKLGESGCYLSHMYCLNDAIINQYSKIIIFEDDIILHKAFNELFEKITTGQNFDILFLGASDFNFYRLNYPLINRDKNIYYPHIDSSVLRGTFSIFYSLNGCLEVFNNRLTNPTFMDNNIIDFSKTFKDSFCVCYPNIVIADLSTTNIEHNFWITNQLKEKYYYRNCYNNLLHFSDYNYVCIKLFSNCVINIDVSYEDNITNILCKFFRKTKERKSFQILKERLAGDFFTIEDLTYICQSYNSL